MALASSNREEERPGINRVFDPAGAQMMHGNPFTTRAETLPDHNRHYQQPVSLISAPQQMEQASPAADFRQHDHYSPHSGGRKNRKSSNVKGTIGGGLLGFALTGRLSGLAGGAMVGNLYSKRQK